MTDRVDTSSPMVDCPKCGGGGRLPQYDHIEGGVCFLCNGKKTITKARADSYNAYLDRQAAGAIRHDLGVTHVDDIYVKMRDSVIANVLKRIPPEIEVDPWEYANGVLLKDYQISLPGLVAKRMAKRYNQQRLNDCKTLDDDFSRANPPQIDWDGVYGETGVGAEEREEMEYLASLDYEDHRERMIEQGHSIP